MDVVHGNNGFVATVRGFQARGATPSQANELRQLIDRAGVLVLKDQKGLDDDALLAFARLFGTPHRSIAANRPDIGRRLGSDELSDISNLAADGSILPPDDMRRVQQRANLIWHTDNAFRSPAGEYTMLAAREVPDSGGETQFADTRAAYAALSDTLKAHIDNLKVEHWLANSRRLAGTDGVFESIEDERFPPCMQPLVRSNSRSGAKALYIGSHAARVLGFSDAESAILLNELMEFSTQSRFVHQHSWSPNDLVMWDNTATMHRAMPFRDTEARRDLRRVSTVLAE